MKIIQQGRPVTDSVRFTCTNCDCVFEAEKNDEAERAYGDFWKCRCPNCQKVCTGSE